MIETSRTGMVSEEISEQQGRGRTVHETPVRDAPTWRPGEWAITVSKAAAARRGTTRLDRGRKTVDRPPPPNGEEMSGMTWRECFEESYNDGPIVAVAPNEEALDVQFDDGFGGSEGPAVLIWTERYVYFPVVYDGSEWLGRAPRNPQSEGQQHVGGE